MILDGFLLSMMFVVGAFVGTFFLLAALLILFFRIPFTLKLKRLGVIKRASPLPTYTISFCLLVSLFLLSVFVIHNYSPISGICGFWIGVLVVLLLGIGKCGANTLNVTHYYIKNLHYIDAVALDQVRQVLEQEEAGGNSLRGLAGVNVVDPNPGEVDLGADVLEYDPRKGDDRFAPP